jgi:hypothetical protein
MTSLLEIDCSNNGITSLNVGGLWRLYALKCNHNLLNALNVIPSLIYLECSNNLLTTLNAGAAYDLDRLDCSSNLLTSLFIKNTSHESSLTFSTNPNLNYICVDSIQLLQVENLVNTYGITDCLVDTACALSSDSFELSPITVFPNPASTFLHIDSKEKCTITSINIYNSFGQLLLKLGDVHQIDVSGLAVGTYFIRLISDFGTYNTKFLKK